AAVIAGLYTLCVAALYAFYGSAMGVGRYMFHGVALNETNPLISPYGFLVGLVAWAAVGLVGGYAYALVYNKLARAK
ncbi:hypothetical protein HY095_05225, partial [Candidatus Micrarchaeota archaeon]|nr:hypothetical protein [Candidatus Micrarchaeota archaeon]